MALAERSHRYIFPSKSFRSVKCERRRDPVTRNVELLPTCFCFTSRNEIRARNLVHDQSMSSNVNHSNCFKFKLFTNFVERCNNFLGGENF